VTEMTVVFPSIYHNGSQSQSLFWNRKYPSGWSDGGLPFLSNKGEEFKMKWITEGAAKSID